MAQFPMNRCGTDLLGARCANRVSRPSGYFPKSTHQPGRSGHQTNRLCPGRSRMERHTAAPHDMV